MLTKDFEVLDKRFEKLVMGNVHVDLLYTGTRWAEGPAYFPAGKYLVWSDIPNNRLLRYDETDGSVSVFAERCGFHNGHTVDQQGRLISCEHLARCVSRIEHDGSYTVLASEYEGRRLNSPNDVVVKSDGTVWFTDPTYGIESNYEGDRAPQELQGCWVFRLDPVSGRLDAVGKMLEKPNGLAFSPDEKILYIADTGISHVENGPRHIRAFELSQDGRGLIGDGPVFATCDVGVFDGFRVDRQGNVWSSAGDGVRCYAPDGTLIGRVRIPEVTGNVCFGGPKRNRLYVCGTTSLYAVYLNTEGCSLG